MKKKYYYKKNTKDRLNLKGLWQGIVIAAITFMVIMFIGVGSVLAFVPDSTIYSLHEIPKLFLWVAFFLSGYIAALKSGYKGWQHGLAAGISLGIISLLFMIAIFPLSMILEVMILYLFASIILGVSGGIVGLRSTTTVKKTYSLTEFKKQSSKQLDSQR
ncbi:hypothetical protein SAMN00017405_1904 [Desulfonispora thiosulfatigenes DSM 11270]|uniref:Uncharacterized protein n=1 Tax=Desulfonispora thiosulfatigenes DSM 11270 TaxID=656914 RepID=A0A1W1VGN7_DESTI|nr:TIGR04086 family membrane protein [Desulfonispora thiosulfatigenes]SMB92114.1 hypothetical protein SAMN00017405_1904 [Desulfonispora thiosulfatigenes DSM 11270]